MLCTDCAILESKALFQRPNITSQVQHIGFHTQEIFCLWRRSGKTKTKSLLPKQLYDLIFFKINIFGGEKTLLELQQQHLHWLMWTDLSAVLPFAFISPNLTALLHPPRFISFPHCSLHLNGNQQSTSNTNLMYKLHKSFSYSPLLNPCLNSLRVQHYLDF